MLCGSGAFQEWNSLSWKCSSRSGEPLEGFLQVHGEIQPQQSTLQVAPGVASASSQFLHSSSHRWNQPWLQAHIVLCGVSVTKQAWDKPKNPPKKVLGSFRVISTSYLCHFPPLDQHRVFRFCCLTQSWCCSSSQKPQLVQEWNLSHLSPRKKKKTQKLKCHIEQTFRLLQPWLKVEARLLSWVEKFWRAFKIFTCSGSQLSPDEASFPTLQPLGLPALFSVFARLLGELSELG